jgi:hypothetical protein
MITLDLLKAIFGESGKDYFDYLNNKNRGGISNSKGNTFENFFTVYKIAKAFNDNQDLQKTLFSSQLLCFIDDLVIEQSENKNNWHYQIKDVASIEWNNSDHPLKDDFKNQHEICLNLGIKPYLRLVISRSEIYEHLASNIPKEIEGLVKVVNFETASSLNNLIRNNSLIKEELLKMCALTNPSMDKLNTLAAILLSSWNATNKSRISLKELLDNSYSQNPHYIKGFATKISQKLDDILKIVDGFSYIVENGYLKWKYYGTDDGVLQYRIGSIEFEQWENDLFNATIQTFEDLESFLAS